MENVIDLYNYFTRTYIIFHTDGLINPFGTSGGSIFQSPETTIHRDFKLMFREPCKPL